MFLAFGNYVNFRLQLLLFAVILLKSSAAQSEVGDACKMQSEPGICTEEDKCPLLRELSMAKRITNKDIVGCGLGPYGELICCPTNPNAFSPEPTDFWSHLLNTTVAPTTSTITTTSTTSPTTTTTTTTENPAFWLHLLSTTTQAPLMFGGEQLNTTSEYIDLSQILTGQNGMNNNNDRDPPNWSNSNNPANINSNSEFIGPAQQNAAPPNWQIPQINNNRGHVEPNRGFITNLPLQQSPQLPNAPNRNNFGNTGPNQGFNMGPQQQLPPNWQTPQINNNRGNVAPNMGFSTHPQQRQLSPNWSNANNANGRPNIGFPNVQTVNWPNSNNGRDSRANNGFRFPGRPNRHGNRFPNNGRGGPHWNQENNHFIDRDIYQNPNHAIFPSNEANVNQFEPISVINNNLINSGMDVVTGQLDDYHRVPATWSPEPAPQSSDVVNAGFHNHAVTNAFPLDQSSTPPRTGERPSVKACREYDEYARSVAALLTPHILNGIPAEFGEYPHMAAIGFQPLGGNPGSNYDFRCGATLIAKRFVLTAAHCVAGTQLEPQVVRLNFTDFTDAQQLYVEIPIAVNGIHLHPEYKISSTYHDIAVIELESDVPFSKTCRPTCLYTQRDTPENEFLFAAGWGVVNTTRRSTSNILFKVGLKIQPLEACNASYVDYGLNRRFAEGIKDTQLCAHDAEKLKDACQGDSGGPLVSVVDESLRTYRVVGVVSAGFSCASDTAGLYTRVSAYLDFVEKIVWPAT